MVRRTHCLNQILPFVGTDVIKHVHLPDFLLEDK